MNETCFTNASEEEWRTYRHRSEEEGGDRKEEQEVSLTFVFFLLLSGYISLCTLGSNTFVLRKA